MMPESSRAAENSSSNTGGPVVYNYLLYHEPFENDSEEAVVDTIQAIERLMLDKVLSGLCGLVEEAESAPVISSRPLDFSTGESLIILLVYYLHIVSDLFSFAHRFLW